MMKWKLNLKKNEMGMVLPYGFGDTYLVCSLLNEYKSKKLLSCIKLIVKNKHEEIAKLFGIKTYAQDSTDFKKNLEAVTEFGSEKAGEIFVAHPHYADHAYVELLGYKGITLLDVYKIMFNLNINSTLALPDKKLKSANTVLKNLKSVGMKKGKGVIIFPDANSVDTLSDGELLKLIKASSSLGYKTYYSSNDARKNIPRDLFVNIPVSEIISATNYAGHIICMRSGICEILSTSSAKMAIMYPKVVWYNARLIVSCSLKAMGIRNNVFEIEIGKHLNDITIKKIFSALK